MNTFESIQHNTGSFDSHSHTETSETFKNFQQQVREYVANLAARISEHVVSEDVPAVYDDFTENDLAVLSVEDMYQWKMVIQLDEYIADLRTSLDSKAIEEIGKVAGDFNRYRDALLSADQSDPIIKSRLVFSRILADILETILQRKLLTQERQDPNAKVDVDALRKKFDIQIKEVIDRFKGSRDEIISSVDHEQSLPRHQVDDSQFIQ